MHFQLRQKEAVIQTLQNQINPHLLYNTLDIIKSIAYLEGNGKIEIISGHLADIYRYSTNLQDIQVELSEELVILQKYLDIIKVRFPRRFYSKMQVDENLKKCRIIKLSLQPVVENAVKYAVETTEGKSGIFINAFEEKDDLIIEISDDGPGFNEELLGDFANRFAEISANENPKLLKIQSVGLINVHMRMVLQYGQKYGICVNSSKQNGTTIFLRYPLSYSEK
jgi:two-component system sensor histidine kinase YesM